MADSLKAQLKTKLSIERGGATLGAGLVELIALYLVEDCEFKDVNEFKESDVLEYAKATWAERKVGRRSSSCAGVGPR